MRKRMATNETHQSRWPGGFEITSSTRSTPTNRYDQFIIEQLAGDELPEVTAETLTATGFYRLGIWDDEPADRLLAKYDGLDDIVKTTGEVVLGMSLGCCRCHDHKGDPIDQDEYYGFLAYFHDVTYSNRENLRSWVTEADKAAHEKMLVEKRES